MNRLARAAFGAALVAVFVFGAATPVAAAYPASPVRATADPAACEPTYLADSPRELFAVDAMYVPPPLRSVDFDCASRTGDADFGSEEWVDYYLLLTDADLDDLIGMVRSFEEAGWISGPSVLALTTDGGYLNDGEALDADQLEALDEQPALARARFSDVRTGRNIIELNYGAGDYTNDQSLQEPSVLVHVQVRDTFVASGFTDPSVLSSLRTVQQAIPTPVQLAVVAGSSVILMLIVGYPGALLSAVVKARYDEVAAWMRTRRRRAAQPAQSAQRAQRTPPLWLLWVGFVAAAVIGGFVDPNYGLNLMSLRMLVGSVLAFAIFNFAAWMLTRRVLLRLEPQSRPYIRFRWGSLVVLALAVLGARLLEFDPGVVFGLVSGLAFGAALAASRDALTVLLGSGFGLAVALLAWVGYSLLAPVAAAQPGILIVSEFFASLTIQGISSLPLALLPFAVLHGGKLIRWKKWVWAVAYSIGLAAFMLVLLTVPKSFGEVEGDFLRWLALFGSFAVLSVLVWAVDAALLRRRKRRAQSATAPTATQSSSSSGT